MNTPTQMNTSSASAAGIVPSETASATAIATACWAGPNICTACLASLIVTFLNRIVFGFNAPRQIADAPKLSLLTASAGQRPLGPVGQIERFSPQAQINHPKARSARRREVSWTPHGYGLDSARRGSLADDRREIP